MITIHIDEIVRAGNLVLSVICLLLLAVGAVRQYAEWNEKTKAHFYALTTMVFSVGIASIAALVYDYKPAPHVYSLFVALLILLYALTRKSNLYADSVMPTSKKKRRG
jgi:4-amino-4-deoxy-L-arabinose transferase-like glycosyltransferase